MSYLNEDSQKLQYLLDVEKEYRKYLEAEIERQFLLQLAENEVRYSKIFLKI